MRQSLEEMSRQAGAAISTSVSPTTGLATFVSVPRASRLRVPLPATAPPTERALRFLDTHGAAFGIARRDQLAAQQATIDRLGFERVRNYDGSWTEYGNAVRVPIER